MKNPGGFVTGQTNPGLEAVVESHFSKSARSGAPPVFPLLTFQGQLASEMWATRQIKSQGPAPNRVGVLRLRWIIRFADDPAPLRMTGLGEGGKSGPSVARLGRGKAPSPHWQKLTQLLHFQ